MQLHDIMSKIKNKEVFSAYADDRSFFIAVDEWVPFACISPHSGSNLRKELRDKIALSKMERWMEEDPFTGQFISSLPIRIVCFDSRYEYDLNRKPEECIYIEAWGRKVWKAPLSEAERQRSLSKHANFYKVVETLVLKLEELFNAAVIYDIHSYNYTRRNDASPVFNIGCERIDRKFRKDIRDWRDILGQTEIPGFESTCEINAVFRGYGELLAFISSRFPKTLVLATEIKKIYCDEGTGDEFHEIIDALAKVIKDSVLTHARVFANSRTKIYVKKKGYAKWYSPPEQG